MIRIRKRVQKVEGNFLMKIYLYESDVTKLGNYSRFKKKKPSKKDEKREEKNKLEKRLSTMAEEDEDDQGITIKVTEDSVLHL